ncbi:MAG: hypothetical protein ACE5RI_06520 [Candidatus Nitrosomaritimum yanchengensis]
MNFKFIFLSVLVIGLIVNTASFSDLAFADKPDKEEKKGGQGQKTVQKTEAKAEREEVRAEAKAEREEAKAEREEAKAEREEVRAEAKAEREEIKTQKKEVEEFADDVLVTSSSTTTICHIPPGNPGNNHTITIGESALSAHLGHGDLLNACDYESESNSNEVEEFGDDVLVTSSSTTTICHIPPGNPGNNHTITIGESALSAHLGHGDLLNACDYESESNSNEETINANENAIEQIRKQIENLQIQLQKLLGL